MNYKQLLTIIFCFNLHATILSNHDKEKQKATLKFSVSGVSSSHPPGSCRKDILCIEVTRDDIENGKIVKHKIFGKIIVPQEFGEELMELLDRLPTLMFANTPPKDSP